MKFWSTKLDDALALASAAVFVRDARGEFVRTKQLGWSERDGNLIAQDDPLVENIVVNRKPLDLTVDQRVAVAFPHDLLQPLLAIPLHTHRDVLGVVFYGGHCGGEAIDPDERRILRHVALSAALAYHYVRTAALVAPTSIRRNSSQ